MTSSMTSCHVQLHAFEPSAIEVSVEQNDVSAHVVITVGESRVVVHLIGDNTDSLGDILMRKLAEATRIDYRTRP